MNRTIPHCILLALAMTFTPLVKAADATCDVDRLMNAVMDQFGADGEPLELLAARAREAPAQAPATTQTAAPSATESGTANADSPERPSWISLAIEQGFATENDRGGVTIQLSPFNLLERSAPANHFDDQGRYIDVSGLRRITAALSLGDRGEAFDSDGDGAPNDAESAKEITDSVLLEVQYRFGTRDRRELTLTEAGLAGLPIANAASARYTAARARLTADPAIFDMLDSALADESRAIDCTETARTIAATLGTRSDLREAVAELKAAATALDGAVTEIVQRIDGGMVWSVAGSVQRRDDYLGRDSVAIAVRGLKGVVDQTNPAGGSTWLLNVDYRKDDALGNILPSTRAARIVGEYNGRLKSPKGGDLPWALSLAAEKTWDAPEGARDSQALVGIVVKFPIADGVSVPVSLRWSNRDQLLQDSDEIVGNIGISFDLDELMK
jgi:hypothetical protein